MFICTVGEVDLFVVVCHEIDEQVRDVLGRRVKLSLVTGRVQNLVTCQKTTSVFI